jgi:hypothetical protein
VEVYKPAADRGVRIHSVMEGTRTIASLNKSDRICAERIMFEEARLIDELNFEGAVQIKEERFWAFGEGFEKLVSAKPDVVHVLNNRALIINYKTGHYAPDPIVDNWQMHTEGAIVADSLGYLQEVTTCMIHPNVGVDGKLSQFTTFDRPAILRKLWEIKSACQEALLIEARLTPGDAQCKFCKAKKMGLCDTYKDWERLAHF